MKLLAIIILFLTCTASSAQDKRATLFVGSGYDVSFRLGTSSAPVARFRLDLASKRYGFTVDESLLFGRKVVFGSTFYTSTSLMARRSVWRDVSLQGGAIIATERTSSFSKWSIGLGGGLRIDHRFNGVRSSAMVEAIFLKDTSRPDNLTTHNTFAVINRALFTHSLNGRLAFTGGVSFSGYQYVNAFGEHGARFGLTPVCGLSVLLGSIQ